MSTSGAHVALVSKGAQDAFLLANDKDSPSHFRSRFVRHTNFVQVPRYIKTISADDNVITIPAHGDLLNAIWFEGDVYDVNVEGSPTPTATKIATKLFRGATFDLFIGGVKVDSHKYEYLSDIWTSYLANTWTRAQEINNAVSQTTENFVPLQFFFCEPGCFLPLLACAFHECEIRITFDGAQMASLTNEEKKARVYGMYTFLDTDERKRMLERESMDFVIRQVQSFTTNIDTILDNRIPGGDNSIDLSMLRHPVSSLFWGWRANSADSINDRFTFRDATLLLNGVEHFEKVTPLFCHTVQNYYRSKFGIIEFDDTNQCPFYTRFYSYHFCTSPSEYAHTGSVNFSRLDNAKLYLTGCERGADRPVNQDLTVFAVNWQVLRFKHGLCGVLFGS